MELFTWSFPRREWSERASRAVWGDAAEGIHSHFDWRGIPNVDTDTSSGPYYPRRLLGDLNCHWERKGLLPTSSQGKLLGEKLRKYIG